MTTLIAAALVFTVVVFVHELGHLLAARWAGVRVQAFSVGLGPVLFRLRRGATEYRLSALPFGGYVRLAGVRIFENPDDDTPVGERFRSKSRLARLGIYLAGPAASVALGVVLLTVSYASGVGVPTGGDPRSLHIAAVQPSSGAWNSGLRPGDEVMGAATECFVDGDAFSERFASSAGQNVELLISRAGAERTVLAAVPDNGDLGTFGVVLTPLWLEPGRPSSMGAVVTSARPDMSTPARVRVSPREAFVQSLQMTRETAEGTGSAISDAASGRTDLSGVMGPIGIAWFSGRMADRFGLWALVWVAGVLSLAVAFFNLIPMPPLDGGQAAILTLEAIAGRDLGSRARIGLSLIGIAALLALVVVTTYADVLRLLR